MSRASPRLRNCRHLPHQDGHVTADKLGCERWQPVVVTMGPAKLDRDVATFHEAALDQSLAERVDKIRRILRRPAAR